jgi:hypothetical protein
MKKTFIFLAALLMAFPLASCNDTDETSYEDNSFTQTVVSGNLGFFSLVSPASSAILDEVPGLFVTESENASYYTWKSPRHQTSISNDISLFIITRLFRQTQPF